MSEQAGSIGDEELVERLPFVQIDHDSKHHHRGWFEKRLLINRCDGCSHWHHPPRPICPRCWSRDLTPTEVSGRGTIHLLILLHQGPPAPGVDYGAAPHPVATVELEEQEGLRFTTTIVNCPLEEIRVGLPVQLAWIERSGAPFPVFQPAEQAHR